MHCFALVALSAYCPHPESTCEIDATASDHLEKQQVARSVKLIGQQLSCKLAMRWSETAKLLFWSARSVRSCYLARFHVVLAVSHEHIHLAYVVLHELDHERHCQVYQTILPRHLHTTQKSVLLQF